MWLLRSSGRGRRLESSGVKRENVSFTGSERGTNELALHLTALEPVFIPSQLTYIGLAIVELLFLALIV